MPLYEYECPECLGVMELTLPLRRFDEEVHCPYCKGKMRKCFNKITPVWKGKDRKWGTSLFRKHDGKEKVGIPKMPTHSPLLKRKGEN